MGNSFIIFVRLPSFHSKQKQSVSKNFGEKEQITSPQVYTGIVHYLRGGFEEEFGGGGGCYCCCCCCWFVCFC